MAFFRYLLTIVIWSLVVTTMSAQDKVDPDMPPEDDAPPEVDLLKPQVELDTGGHTGEVMKLFYTPDGKQLVTVGQDQTIRYWDAQTGEAGRVLRLQCFLHPLGHSSAAALSADGKTLALFNKWATENKKRSIVFVDVEQGRVSRVLQLLDVPGDSPICLAFSPDGKWLAFGFGYDSEFAASMWDVGTGKRIFQVKQDNRPGTNEKGARSLAFSPDNQRLAVATEYGRLHVVKVPSGEEDVTLDDLGKGLHTVAWAPTEPILAIGGTDQVTLWNTVKWERLQSFTQCKRTHSLSWSADGKQLLRTFQAGKVELINAESGKVVRAFSYEFPQPHPNDATFSPDGKWVAFAAGNFHSIYVRGKEDGKELWTVRGQGSAVVACAWTSDVKTIAIGQGPGQFAKLPSERRLEAAFDLAALRPLTAAGVTGLDQKMFHRQVYELDGFKLAPTGVVAVTRDDQKTVLNPWRSARTLLAGNRVAFSTGANHAGIRLRDLAKGKKTADLNGHRDRIMELAPSPDGNFLLSASMDQTLKIWSIKPGEEKLLLTLFVAGPDWIIWTPEGYYAASPGGERLMGWTVFQGYDKPKLFFPAERFRKRLYRPDVIKLVLEIGNVAEALKMANAALKKEGIAVSDSPEEVNKLLPPQVKISLLKKSDDGVVTLHAEATPGCKEQPVASMCVLVDGRPLPDNQGRSVRSKDDWTLTLPAGRHQVTVLARSADVPGLSDPLSIDNRPQKDKPVMHVLSVGIDDYDDKDIQLKSAVHDARLLARTLESACEGDVYGKVRAQTLLNKEATTAAVLEKIRGFKKETTPVARGNDLVVVYLAVHGLKQKETFYFLTREAERDNLAKTALSSQALQDALTGFPCPVLVIMDARHPGAVWGKNLQPGTDDATRALTNEQVGVMVLCSAHNGEKSEEKDGQGLFTKALVEALVATKDLPVYNPTDQRQYLRNVATYTEQRVQALSNGNQNPDFRKPEALIDPIPLRQVLGSAPGQR